MTSVVLDRLAYAPMRAEDVDEVVAIERTVYPHPWTPGNFSDSLASGYQAWVIRDQGRALVGYFLLMEVIDEGHLLNVAVAAEHQRAGVGRYLMDKVVACARGLGLKSLLLEVRPSNNRALEVYYRYGFVQIGRRKAYYPAHNQQREDAIVMRMPI